MKLRKPILHARDHLPGGADPIPVGTPVPPPGGTDGPEERPAGPHGSPQQQRWHWWPLSDVHLAPGVTTPDSHGNEVQKPLNTPCTVVQSGVDHTPDVMPIGWSDDYPLATHPPHSIEVFRDQGGPQAGMHSILRIRDAARNPDNYWYAGATNQSDVANLPSGVGSNWSFVAWFNPAVVRNYDLMNVMNRAAGHPNPTWLGLTSSGGVTVTREGASFTSAPGLISAGSWAYVALVATAGRLKVYVNPGPPEDSDADATYGSDFPFSGPMGMDTWGLQNGDYTADQLAAKLTANGYSSVAVQLNPDPPKPGETHADYIARLSDDVATLQAAGLEVIGWGITDSNTGTDLSATGVTGWIPQVEGPGQYDSCMAALAAGVGAGLPKAVATNFGGLEDPADVAALAAAGIDSAFVYVYAEVGYPHTDANAILWQATQQGFDASKVAPLFGTYRGEYPDDYTNIGGDVFGNFGIYNVPQTTDDQLAAFGELGAGLTMFSKPVIDVPDPATTAITGSYSIGGPLLPLHGYSADGCFEGYVSNVLLYEFAITSAQARGQYESGKYGGTSGGTVPPHESIPPGGVTPVSIAPGVEGQHLVTQSSRAVWDFAELGDNADVDTAGAADDDVLTYDAATSNWHPAPGGGGGEAWFSGTGVPSGSLGAVGDWYIDAATGDFYEKTGASAWTLRGNLKGPAGAAGATGAPGADGVPGERWFTGSGAPSGSLAGSVVGDWYLDSASGDFYEKTGASIWTVRGNLMGPAGSSGGAGAADVQTFTGSGTWTKPTGVKVVHVICAGGGGGGGGGFSSGGAAARSGGGGGGGGAVFEDTFRAADLTGTVAVTVGVGGSGAASAVGPGNDGAASSFGSYTLAGGGGGGLGSAGAASAGAAGGTYLGSASGNTPPSPNAASGAALGNQAARGVANGGAGNVSELGGAAGGGALITTAAAGAGGSSTRAGSGGGGGAGHTTTPAVGSAGAGGLAGAYTAGGGGGGGASGAAPAAGGIGGAVSGRLCGSGGGGGGSTVTAATNGGNGGAGGIGSGGGGGGASSGATGGTGGRGGDGLIIVISW